MEISKETLEAQIPYYLSNDKKKGLVKALSDFKDRPHDYYISGFNEEYLQGDAWTNLNIFRFEDGQRGNIKGIILSNTCDILPDNIRDLSASVVFSPIIKLNNYIKYNNYTRAGFTNIFGNW